MVTIDTVATGNNIRRLRKINNMSIADVQDICCCTAAAVGKWQRGDCMPTIDNLVILANNWGIKIDDIIKVKDV